MPICFLLIVSISFCKIFSSGIWIPEIQQLDFWHSPCVHSNSRVCMLKKVHYNQNNALNQEQYTRSTTLHQKSALNPKLNIMSKTTPRIWNGTLLLQLCRNVHPVTSNHWTLMACFLFCWFIFTDILPLYKTICYSHLDLCCQRTGLTISTWRQHTSVGHLLTWRYGLYLLLSCDCGLIWEWTHMRVKSQKK